MSTKNRQLILIFTRGISLRRWVESGLLNREKLIYEQFLSRGILDSVTFATYGKDDCEVLRVITSKKVLIGEFNVLPMPRWWFFGAFIYSFMMPLIHYIAFKKANFIKTNQMDGSWAVLLVKLVLPRKQIVFRSGYNLVAFTARENKKIKAFIYEFLIKLVLKVSDKIIVTSQEHYDFFEMILKNSNSNSKMKLIGNYIDTSIFYPSLLPSQINDKFLFVGRLEEVKNVFNLVEAFKSTNQKLVIVGDGSLKEKLRKGAESNKNILFLGTIKNDEIPKILREHSFFILPSLTEGNPKALLEAMAAGLICLATPVEGINEIVKDGINGYLANGTSTEDLIALLERVKTIPVDMLSAVSREAHNDIVARYSLENIIQTETVFCGYKGPCVALSGQ